ncbi:MAG: beta-aspartyl-peptidase [Armatimonadetes bacterium]|nr:beta-aspartyl-peptidase [Armatimonadota bacterium]
MSTVARWPVNDGMTLLRGGRVFAPEDLGEQDVLVGGGRVLHIGRGLEIPAAWEDVQVVDARGKYVIPGLIDPHVHIAGGGGEGGPATRNFDIQLTDITRYGVTTVAGVLGVDATSKDLATVLGRAQGLDIEGITTYAWAGSYTLPPATITGSVTRDVACVEKILGVKVAISDHRGSQVTVQEIARLAAQARMGGLIGRKPGLLHLHVGHSPRGIEPLVQAVESTEIPITQFYPTHMNRRRTHVDQAKDWLRRGGIVDVTAGIAPAWGFPEATKPSAAIREFLESGASPLRITMSSDANGNMIRYGESGRVEGVVVQSARHLHHELRDLVMVEKIPVPVALAIATTSPARLMKIDRRKGYLGPGADGDVVVTEPDLAIVHVYARGACLVRGGQPVVVGTFERAGEEVAM